MVFGDTELIYMDFDHKTFENVTKAGPVILARRNGKQTELWPHNSVYPDGKTTSEVAVQTQLLQDIYLTFDGISEEGGVLVTATAKPMMLWLWISAILISTGTVIALLESGRQKI